MSIHVDHEPESDSLSVLFYEGSDDPQGVRECVEIDDRRRLFIDQDGAPCVLEILGPGNAGTLQLDRIAGKYGFKDRLTDVYRAIAETYAQEQRIAA